jgi:hypothetical protein
MLRTWQGWITIAMLIEIIALGGRALATGGGYQLLRCTVEQSNAATFQNSNYQLQGTIGQPFASVSASGNTQLGAGCWNSAGSSTRKNYLPLTQR